MQNDQDNLIKRTTGRLWRRIGLLGTTLAMLAATFAVSAPASAAVPVQLGALSTWNTSAVSVGSGNGQWQIVNGDTWQYQGTGTTQSGYQQVHSQSVTVSPGATYTLSGAINATNITSASYVDFQILDPGWTTSYLMVSQSVGTSGSVSGTVTIPSGVTQVIVAAQLGNPDVLAGTPVTFSQIQLAPGIVGALNAQAPGIQSVQMYPHNVWWLNTPTEYSVTLAPASTPAVANQQLSTVTTSKTVNTTPIYGPPPITGYNQGTPIYGAAPITGWNTAVELGGYNWGQNGSYWGVTSWYQETLPQVDIAPAGSIFVRSWAVEMHGYNNNQVYIVWNVPNYGWIASYGWIAWYKTVNTTPIYGPPPITGYNQGTPIYGAAPITGWNTTQVPVVTTVTARNITVTGETYQGANASVENTTTGQVIQQGTCPASANPVIDPMGAPVATQVQTGWNTAQGAPIWGEALSSVQVLGGYKAVTEEHWVQVQVWGWFWNPNPWGSEMQWQLQPYSVQVPWYYTQQVWSWQITGYKTVNTTPVYTTEWSTPPNPAFPNYSGDPLEYGPFFTGLGICNVNPNNMPTDTYAQWAYAKQSAQLILQPSWSANVSYNQVTTVVSGGTATSSYTPGTTSSSVPVTQQVLMTGTPYAAPAMAIKYITSEVCAVQNGQTYCPTPPTTGG